MSWSGLAFCILGGCVGLLAGLTIGHALLLLAR
jgi:hypothetical protein